MGHRANLVVVQDGGGQLYYDHWCSNRLDIELFWGPELALQFIEQREETSEWLDDVWGEGAVLIDLDDRVLLFFGGEDIKYELPRRRAFLALMSANWPGWDIRWAHDHIVSLAHYLNFDPAPFIAERQANEGFGFEISKEYPEDNATLLTVSRAGKTTAFRVCGKFEALATGSRALDVTGTVPAMNPLVWEGMFPNFGAHVDYDQNALSFWSCAPIGAAEQRVAAGWPGWQTNWLRDDVEKHIAIAGLDIQLPHWPLAELQGKIIEYLRRCHFHEGRNLARDLLKTMDEGAELNPATDFFRGSVGSEEEKLALLDRLASQLPIGGPAHH